MSYQNESFGMMDSGYFVPRGEILSWINELLKLNISKIQVLGSGAIYCQIIDVIHPGKVALNKVNWKARNEYEFINNLKALQNAFDKIGLKRHVQVEKLAKAKYQDNLQFIQWLKRYYDMNCGERGNNYMAQQKRGNVVIDFSFAEKTVVPKTYNASGAVKATNTNTAQKVQVKKPTASTTNLTKVQQSDTRMKIPTDNKTRTQVTNKKVEPKSTALKTVRTQIKLTKTQQIETEPQKTVQKQIVIEYRTDPKLQSQLQQAFADVQQAKKQSQSYHEKLQQAQVKLDMIKQIIQSQDDSTMKISLIQEISKD